MILIGGQEYVDKVGYLAPFRILDVLNIPHGIWKTLPDGDVSSAVITYLNNAQFMKLVGAPELDYLSNLDKMIVFHFPRGDELGNLICMVFSFSYSKEDLMNLMKRTADMKAFL